MFALLFGAMYFLFIRPQSKRRKEAAAMQNELGAGDEIVTIGGLYGTVVTADDKTITLEISPGVTAKYSRQAVAQVLTQTNAAAEAAEVDHPVDEPVSPVQESKKKS
jgi:preprotein translocase subunit YajC